MPTADHAPIILLGRSDQPTDGVRDYCSQLSRAFASRGEQLEIDEMRWEVTGWLSAIRKLWKQSKNWKGRWIIIQYTALMWSRRGLPAGALAVLWILKLRGANTCMVFHDIRYDNPRGLKNRFRVLYQYGVMKVLYRTAARSILTVPANNVPWLPEHAQKFFFIPVGSNFPSERQNERTKHEMLPSVPIVVVFGVTGGSQSRDEAADISYVARQVIKKTARLQLVVLGRGSLESKPALRKYLDGSGVELSVLGVLPPERLREQLVAADALVCVRGHISTRRGSAIAGVACGLPVVGYRGEETAFPITEAGLLLVDNGDREGIAHALGRVLSDDKLRTELRDRSLTANTRYFSWEAIAAEFARVLSDSPRG